MDDSQEWPAMVSLLKPRRRSLHATITPAFGLSLLLFCLVASLAYKNTDRLIITGQRIAQGNEVLARLATAATLLERAEVEQREYLLTGSSQPLDRMHAAISQTHDALHAVRDLTADSPAQQQALTRLEVLANADFDAMQRVADIRAADGMEAAAAAVHQTDTAATIKPIRDLFELMRAEESYLVRDRTAKLMAETRNRTLAFAGMGVSVLLGMALSYALVLEFEAHCRKGERDLQEAKKAAETANEFKSSFLASMSHEIRTPMTAIIGFADLLLRPNLSESDRSEYVDTVRRNGAHLLNLVNDILDLSKIEAGKMEVERISCSPVQIIDDVVTLLKQRTTEKAIGLDVQYVGPCPETIQSDPTRLRQILTNLVANAIKFTDRGSIRLYVQLAPCTNGDNRLQFRITDTGIGMTGEQIKNLFQPFTQADVSTSRKFGGTGLGLMIAKQFAQMLGGDINVASQPGAGSTFVVEVATGSLAAVRLLERPQEAVKRISDAKPAGPAPRFAGRILLAEDGLTNQQLICLYLREAGAEVAIADNGRIACEMVAAAAKAGTPFHLILMDMEMPEMDGCEATKHLRNTGQKLPIVALTANAMTSDREQCLTAGCNAFLTKPIDWPRLLDVVAGYLRNKDVSGSRQDDPHLAMVLQTFMAELGVVENNLRTALADNDRERLGKLAHSLKGTAGNCGFSALSQMANDVAHGAKGTMSVENVARETQSLIDLIARSRTPRAA